MELIDLNAEIREKSGKIAARALRKNNAIPAIVYGSKTEPVAISVDKTGFSEMIRKNGSSGLFINLNVKNDSKAARIVLLKEFQMDTFRLNYLHADFQEINLEDKVSVVVPVEATGDAPGVKAGGMLQVIRRELEILCRPADVPDTILVDVSSLEIGDAIHVEEIVVADGIEIPHEVDFTVITVVPPATSSEDESDEELDEEIDTAVEPVEEA